MRQGSGSRKLAILGAVLCALGGAQLIRGSGAEGRAGLEDGPVDDLADPAGALADQAIPGGVQLLRGVLADPDGRRELRFVDPVAGIDEVIAAADWNLPPSAATSAGQLLVCFNVITADDPGVRLVCRQRAKGGGWGERFDAGPAEAGAWLQGVDATTGGWDIRFYRDDGGTYARSYDHRRRLHSPDDSLTGCYGQS